MEPMAVNTDTLQRDESSCGTKAIRGRNQVQDALYESEGLLKAIVETAIDGIITIDETGHVTSFNPAAARLFGYTAQEVRGTNINLLMPSPYHEEHDGNLRNYLETGIRKIIGIRREVIGLRKDGSQFPMDLAISETLLSDRRIFTGIVRDISERKGAELSAVMLAGIVESSSDAVIGKDLDSIVTSWNAAAERIFGYSAREMIGRSIRLIVPPDRQGEEEQILAKMKRGDRIEHFETQRVSKDGSAIDVSVTITPVRDAAGRVVGAYKVVRDITERKRAAAEIRRLNADLEERVIERTVQLQTANTEMEAFSYSVSHDLRAPLRAIDGFSHALLEDYTEKLDANGKDNLKRIRAASQRMGRLIDDLLNLSRLTRVELVRELVDLSKMAGEIVEELRNADPERRASCSIAQGLIANADPRLLHIVLTNLFSNAWKFTSKTSAAQIEFGCTEEGGGQAFFVRDNGAGFDMAYAGKLFGAFQRMHAAKDFQGTGIGLATVQRIVRRHGGRVWAQSAVNAGATFHFTL